ncbi:hypothetical protein [Methyloglobulus sp.]|uniref:hypothetical protein n=1 Tax=Methyloglobulus sp. TaxID=2518622 RepID=UPI0032B877A6
MKKQELKMFVPDKDECHKTAKHQTAMRLDEKSFHNYIGAIEDFDVNDPTQFINAHYQPKNYYQGCFQAAFAESQILMLQTNWSPIILFPRTHEVWFDGDDLELRELAERPLNHKTLKTEMAVVPEDLSTMNIAGTLDKIQNMDAFLWKLACWASKGRYPESIEYNLPVYLKSWPNFTRLLITPHALRIAALLIQRPRSMGNLAQALDIKPQYVFVFISAAHAIGLVDQARRTADNLVQPPDMPPSKDQKLLGQLIGKLRGNEA